MPPGARYVWRDGTIHGSPEPAPAPYVRSTQTATSDRFMDSVNRPGTSSPTTLNQALGQSSIPQSSLQSYINTMFPYGVMTNASLEQTFREKYPYLGAFLNHPEIGGILKQAAAEGWTEQEIYGALNKTNWWQTTNASARAWELLVAEDPAEASRRAAETAAMIQNRARSLGLPMSSSQIMAIATDATKNGWSDAQQIDSLLHSVNWGTLQAGDLTAFRDRIKAIGAEYLVGVSDSTAQSYAIALASGEMSEAGVASLMQKQAKARFGWMADEIDQGVTPSQYFMPVRDTIANELELAPEAVNMMDNQYLGMLEVHDRDTGKMRASTLREAQLAARRDPRWRDTKNAGTMMASAANAMAQAFGRRVI